MTKPFRPPINGGEDACPVCNSAIAPPQQVAIGSVPCPHCAKALWFVRVVPNNEVRVWFFDADDFPEPLAVEPHRVRMKSGSFKSLEGYVVCQGNLADEAIIAVEIFGRPAPIAFKKGVFEYV